MKASELIEKLQGEIDKHGDLDVVWVDFCGVDEFDVDSLRIDVAHTRTEIGEILNVPAILLNLEIRGW